MRAAKRREPPSGEGRLSETHEANPNLALVRPVRQAAPAEGVTIVQRQELHALRPLLASEANCTVVVGLEPRAFRRAVRLLEVPTIVTPDGLAVVVSDLERAMRERGRPLERERRRRAPKASPPTEADELEAMGLTAGGGR